jgi:hypothetical protein
MSLSLLEQWNKGTRSDADSVGDQWRAHLLTLSPEVMLLYVVVFPYNIFAYCSICRVDCKVTRNNRNKK